MEEIKEEKENENADDILEGLTNSNNDIKNSLNQFVCQ